MKSAGTYPLGQTRNLTSVRLWRTILCDPAPKLTRFARVCHSALYSCENNRSMARYDTRYAALVHSCAEPRDWPVTRVGAGKIAQRI